MFAKEVRRMIREISAHDEAHPALLRLSRLSPLSSEERAAVAAALNEPRRIAPRRDLVTEGREITEPMLLVEGWAARVRLLPDGRRQFLSFLLPGDVIGLSGQSRPLALSTVVALTETVCCPAPSAQELPGLAEAYAIARALDESHLLHQIVRLGRLNAQDRIADLMLELHERLSLAGLADSNGFAFPLTQEVLADALGLTSVHVNRMLQALRRSGDLESRNGYIAIPDPQALMSKIGRRRLRVSAER